MKVLYFSLVLAWFLAALPGCDLTPSLRPSSGSDSGESYLHEPALVLGDRGLCAGLKPWSSPSPDRITFLCGLLSLGVDELARLPSEGPSGTLAIESDLIEGWASALDHDERVATIMALGLVGDRRSLDWLLPQPSDSVRSLSEVQEREAWLRVRAWGQIMARQSVRDSLPFSNSAEARFPALLGLLRTQGLVSREAAAALVTLETPELWAPWAPDVRRELLRILDEAGASDEASIEAAVSLVAALGQQRSSDDRSHLLGLMTHEVSSLRAAAVRELSGPGHVEASGIRAVLWDRLLHDPSDGVGALAAEGLLRGLRIPQEVLVDAERLIEEASPSVAYRIGPLLGAVAARRGSEPVIRWTERMLTDHPVAAALGVNAVGGLSDPPLTAVLLSWARHPHPAVEGAAIRALHRRWERIYGGEEEMAQYVALFDEKIQTGGRMAATYALRGLGHPVFLPFGGRQVLEDALEHRVPDAWYGDLAFERDRMLVGLDAFEGRAPGAVPVEVDPEGGVPDRDPLEGTAVSASYLVLELESSALAFELFQGACCPAASMVTEWAVAGRFEGVPLHRVITGFLVQGGDGLAEDGTGGVLTSSVPLLGPAYPFQRGTLGLAVPLDDTPNGIQFFVSVASMPGLDGNYPAIGQLVSDPRVLESIRVGGRILRACLVRDVPVQLEARACESG